MNAPSSPSKPVVATLLGVVLFLSIAAAAWWLLREQPVASSGGDDNRSELVGLSREKLDETVWAPEVEAQRFEQVFIDLWDKLRGESNAFEVLAACQFAELERPTKAESERLDLGILRTKFSAPYSRADHSEFLNILDQFKSAGFNILESEWHHSRFEPKTESGPRSTVSIVLHVAGPSETRFIVRADLVVQWGNEPQLSSPPKAERIRIENLRLLERSGGPAFQLAFTASGRSREFASAHPVILQDLDGDGLSEIILIRWNRVYWNQGEGRFREAKLLEHPEPLWESGVMADFNGDGNRDLLAVAKTGKLVLFAGDNSGRFPTTESVCADVDFDLPSSMAVGDIDADGDLDVWAAQYKLSYEAGQMPTPYYDANDGYPSFLLINDGAGQFSDRTEAAGLQEKRWRRSYSSSLIDLDGDGDLDLLVVSDYAGLDIYENDSRGKFLDVTNKWVDEDHIFGMAHTFGDYNLDGQLDFYAIGMSSTTARRLDYMNLGRDDRPDVQRMRSQMGYGNRMYLGTDKTRFANPQFAADVARTGWSWGTTSVDFDNDGDRDIYVANGHRSGESAQDYCTTFWRHDIYTGNSQPDADVARLLSDALKPLNACKISWNGYEHNAFLLNLKGKGFANVAFLLGAGFEYDSRSVVSDDLDGDGRMDLLVSESTFDGHGFVMDLHVYQNRLATGGHWIGVRLSNGASGVSPIGSVITIHNTSGKHQQHVVTGDSFLAQHANVAHFGLGEQDSVSMMEVRFPNGQTTRLTNPAIDQYHFVPPPRVPVK